MDQTTNQPVQAKTSVKDFFLNLAALVTLYVSIGSLLTLLFTLISKAFPDALSNTGYYYGATYYAQSARFAIAILIIVFPAYLIFLWLAEREVALFPEKKYAAVRRWLSYLTLFMAIGVVIGDLVTVVYTFLNGEITARFILKALAVFIVSGGVFVYYLDIIKGITNPKGAFKRYAIISGVIVLAAVVWGFVSLGSPVNQRKLRFDQTRVSNLQQVQSNILSHWQRKGELPKTLKDLNDPLNSYGSYLPTDPETKQEYTYQVTGTSAFKICATFSADSTQNDGYNSRVYDVMEGNYINQNWQHKKGEFCFDRTIDPKLYPPINKPGTTAPIKVIN